MRGKASAPRKGPPTSLMARLAELENGGVLPAPGKARRSPRPLIYTTARRRRMTAIGLALIGAGLACMAQLAGLLPLPEEARTAGVPAHQIETAALDPAAGQQAQPQSEELLRTSGYRQPLRFEVDVDRSDRTSAPFPLRLTGSAGEGLRILLRNVPESIWLSKGERRDEHTWALQPADLPDLRLTLGEGAPEAFEVTIEVVAPPGTPAVPTLARVRLVDAPATERAAAEAWPGAETIVQAEPRAAAVRAAGTSTHARTARAADAEPRAADVQPPPARHFPEGASALGATPREPSARRLWWRTPEPRWDPFRDILGH